MGNDIAKQLDSFFLNKEESNYAKLSNTKAESKLETCDRSIFIVMYRSGCINAATMLWPWQCEGNPFVFHSLLDNVFQTIFPTQVIKKYVLKHEPWTFDKKLILMHLCSRESINPSDIFDRTHIWFRVYDLPHWCYSPEIGRRLASNLEDSRELEIYKPFGVVLWSIFLV